MMGQCLELMAELSEKCPLSAIEYLGEGAHLAMGAISSCRVYLVNLADKCSDETYRYVTRRENEISLAACRKAYEKILSKVESTI